jgi:hypothetical protein
MTPSPSDDTDSVLIAVPEDAILVDPPLPALASDREWAIAALRQAMADRSLTLPFGPSLDPADPDRLLALNHLAVQLVCTPLLAEEVAIPLAFWRSAASAPQLLLLAAVDDEQGWVHLVGALTASEFVELAAAGQPDGDGLWLPVSAFHGGIARLLLLVRLMRPEALPRLAFPPEPAIQTPSERAVAVWDWLGGRLTDSLAALGGVLLQPAAVAVRSSWPQLPAGSSAGLLLPLDLQAGELGFGQAGDPSVERLYLVVAPAGAQPELEGLIVILQPDASGLCLPDGLCLRVRQGTAQHQRTSQDSLSLELRLPGGDEEIAISVSYGDQPPLHLPAFTLLPPGQFQQG